MSEGTYWSIHAFLCPSANEGTWSEIEVRDSLSRKKLHATEQAWTSEWWEKPQSVGSAGAWQVIGCLHSTSSIRIRTLCVLHSRLRSGKDSDSSLHCSGKELRICHSSFCYWVTSMLGSRLECCMSSWIIGILKGQTSLCSWLFLLFALWGLLTQLPSKHTETLLSDECPALAWLSF